MQARLPPKEYRRYSNARMERRRSAGSDADHKELDTYIKEFQAARKIQFRSDRKPRGEGLPNDVAVRIFASERQAVTSLAMHLTPAHARSGQTV